VYCLIFSIELIYRNGYSVAHNESMTVMTITNDIVFIKKKLFTLQYFGIIILTVVFGVVNLQEKAK